jgi:DNA repair photolyase
MHPTPSLFELEPRPTTREIADAVRLGGIGALPDAVRRADAATYQEVRCRSALNRVHGMRYFEWTLNPYRGCTHGCHYCYARKYQRHLQLGAGDEFSSVILVKANLPGVLARELARPSWDRESVAVGTATDPYQPIEGHYKLTRRCLEALVAAQTPFSIVTKGPMVVRDVDVLQAAARQGECRVYMSVASVDEDAWRILEPGTASPMQRLRALGQLTDAGIDTGVLMMPLVPGITTTRRIVERTIRAIAEAGVPLVGTNVTHLDPGVREHFLAFLAREFPELVEGYERLYAKGKYADAAYVKEIKRLVADVRSTAKPPRGRAPDFTPPA